ncbi:MAG: asparagine synthase (glutamine-hydrolyzing) [Bacteroidetes bacterium]|nr:asparagine synthase (glutamine-hydrolyzing) [Bacteroidota bacterium]
MCGIAGGINTGIREDSASVILAGLHHRGPDDSGTYFYQNLWLGNTRLSIRDLSAAGHQPMFADEGQLALVYNGELYNQDEVRTELRQLGRSFHSECDTETLLQAYCAWGIACLNKLKGDFAFALHDRRRNVLLLARDPMGVKPLYYYRKGQQFLFASELKAITGLKEIDYRLAPEVFRSFLLYQYCTSADTPFHFFKKLLPGHLIEVNLDEPNQAEPQAYYSLNFDKAPALAAPNNFEAALDALLTRTVQAQLASDVPVGIALSGGLDSSLLAAYMRKVAPEQEFQAFTINTGKGMKAEGFDDDIGFARQVAGLVNMPLQEIAARPFSAQDLDAMIWTLDEPQADPAAFYLGNMAQAAAQNGIKVMLGGTGADDIFSGYRRHQALNYLSLQQKVPKTFFRVGSRVAATFLPPAIARRVSKFAQLAGCSTQEALIQLHFWQQPERVAGLFRTGPGWETDKQWAFEPFKTLLENYSGSELLDQMLYLEQKCFLPQHNFAYLDKMSMAHSVELRVPYAAKAIVNFANALPVAMKLKGNTTKFILRQVARNYLPETVISRRKTGFGAPLRTWMQGSMKELIQQRLLDESFYRWDIFDKRAVVQLMADNDRRGRDESYTLFSLLAIESWLRQFGR